MNRLFKEYVLNKKSEIKRFIDREIYLSGKSITFKYEREISIEITYLCGIPQIKVFNTYVKTDYIYI